MSMLAALGTARASLSVVGEQTALISRNIGSAQDPAYSRTYANLASRLDGGIYVSSIERAANASLRASATEASAGVARQQTLSNGLDFIGQVLGTSNANSVPTLLDGLQSALRAYATTPSSDPLARSALDSANALAAGLNEVAAAVQQTRVTADNGLAASAANISDLLKQYSEIDAGIVRATGVGADVSSELDKRDAVVSSLSKELGVRAVERSNGSVNLYTTSGIVLYDGVARAVSFQVTDNLSAGVQGSAMYIDGVDATSPQSPLRVSDGAVAANAALRDSVAPGLQTQLDQLASGVISAFAESDQSGAGTSPDAPGLFTWPGAPAMPGAPPPAGLASQISVNANADPARGGDVARIRDGGLADTGNPAYSYNPAGDASFSGRINALLSQMDATRPFDPAAGLSQQASLATYSLGIVSNLEGQRKSASDSLDNLSVVSDRTNQALSSATGVNIDSEMSKMLDLEHTYQSTAKLISAIDGMLQDLLQAVT